MKDDILDYVFTQEEILVLIYKLIEKLHEITEEVNELQAQQSKDNETKLADMRVELEEFARQIGVFAQNTKDEQDRLVGELEKLDEVVEAKVSDAGADIDAAVDEMEDRIEALRAEIPVLKEKTGSELMSLIGTIPFDRVEGLAEIARQLNSFSEVVHEERSDDSEFVKGELARVEERIDNLPTYEDKFKELNADMYKLSQELVNITPRIEVFVNGNKYASVHRLNFVGSTVTNDNGLVTVTNSGVAGATAWGDITGTLSAQTDLNTALSGKSDTTHNHTGTYAPASHAHVISDVTGLQTALDGKVDENAAITGATKTKITYDAKGLVTSGADATTADIADSLNKRYVTDANLTVIGNTSGTNTGDQTIPDQLSDLTDDATHRLVTDTEKTTWNAKQDALVSGTNIKTINSTSLLGSGNIEISGSGLTHPQVLARTLGA